ncbi:MAG: type II secretion system protein [Candidatus Gracilibacteria bacterium]
MQNNIKIPNSNIKGFTLIELIVVMTIIVILGTVGFISYSGYISTSRDATRVAQIQTINQAFNSYTTGRPPLPDDKVIVYASGVIVGYQGNVGENVLSEIGFKEGGKDPLDNNYYTYFIDSKQRNIQLLTFLENISSLNVSYNGLVNQAKADYTDRIPKPYGSKLGVLVDTGSNSPIQDNIALRSSGIDIVNTTDSYKAYFTDDKYLYGTGLILQKLQQSIINNGVGFAAPASCPDGFIAVPGNIEFNQPGFCVMKYEASYNTPYNLDVTVPDVETDNYTASKIDVVSKVGGYAITKITQGEAINLCKSMGKGYHLITNDEWMTIARDIEQESNNWSGNSVGSGFIYNGRSNNTTMGCDGYANDLSWAEPTGTDCTQKRNDGKSRNILILSNGEEIRDLSGNVWEYVNGANSLDGTNYAINQGSICGTAGRNEFNVCTFVSPYSYNKQGPKTLNLNSKKVFEKFILLH